MLEVAIRGQWVSVDRSSVEDLGGGVFRVGFAVSGPLTLDQIEPLAARVDGLDAEQVFGESAEIRAGRGGVSTRLTVLVNASGARDRPPRLR